MAERLLTFLEHSAQAEDVDALCESFRVFAESFGVEALAFTILPDPFDASDTSLSFDYYTVPDHIRAAYIEERLFDNDPVSRRASLALHPQFWFDVEQTAPVTRVSQRLFGLLREDGFVDGFTISVFGPYGLAAFVTCGRRSAPFSLGQVELRSLQLASQELFRQTLNLRDMDAPPPPHLSEREVEILQWLARGKSNAVIAAILGVSPHTVDTMLRRAFLKLNASNRIEAVIKALRVGLITF